MANNLRGLAVDSRLVELLCLAIAVKIRGLEAGQAVLVLLRLSAVMTRRGEDAGGGAQRA